MGISQQQGYANFNLYDIFANFLPGIIFLVGVLLPYVGLDGLFAELKAGGLLLMVVLSFAVGLFIQAVGGNIQSSGQDFADHIRNVDLENEEEQKTNVRSEPNSAINISTLDAYFVEAFRAELGLGSDFEDWSRLHKLILAKLEATPRSRALRLQALYLAMRGMAVTMWLLALWYTLYLVLVVTDVFSTPLPVWSLPCIIFVSFVAAEIFYERSAEFSKDVAKYMIIEYYLEVIGRQDRTVELDFLYRDDNDRGTEQRRDEQSLPDDMPAQFSQAADQLVEDTHGQAKADEARSEEEANGEENDETRSKS